MIDIQLIRDSPELVKENMKKKFRKDLHLVDDVKKLDEEWRKVKYEEEQLRKERNKISKNIADAKKAKDEKSAEKLMEDAKKIPAKLNNLEEKRKKLENEIKQIMYKIPNIIHESVPIGKDDSENVENRRIGEPKVPDYKILHHAELGEKIKGLDLDSAREVSGHGFYYLCGELALLHSAILAFAKDFMIKRGFEFIIPPYMIRSKVVDGVMSFAEKNVMMYKIEEEDLYLIGTSEHSMIGRFINKTINAENLPLALTSFSPCFRKESGEHGIEEKGLYRVHQFEKQEMIVICEPNESYQWYDKMLQATIDFFRELDVPVRELECCSGDLADLKAKSADVEAWSPRQKKYFEVGSCTNMEEGQARRLNIKIENKGKRYFAHTLNNTVVASPRALIAVMENNQTKDYSIKIPKALWPYMNGIKEIKPKK